MDKLKIENFSVSGELETALTRTERYTPHYEVFLPLGKDAVASFIFDDDGLEWLKENNFITNTTTSTDVELKVK